MKTLITLSGGAFGGTEVSLEDFPENRVLTLEGFQYRLEEDNVNATFIGMI